MRQTVRCCILNFCFGISICFLTKQATAESLQPYYDQSWLKINQYSAVDSFASHGSYGWHFGIGVLSLPYRDQKTESTLDENTESSATPVIPNQIPRLFLTKGTRWPLNLGISLARLNHNASYQFGGHLQWTIYENFQRPAIALRLSRMATKGLIGMERLQTDSAILGISYGFWNYINLSIGIGREFGSLRTRTFDESHSLGLFSDSVLDLKKNSTLLTMQLKINLLSPFLNIGIERIYSSQKDPSSILKLAYML